MMIHLTLIIFYTVVLYSHFFENTIWLRCVLFLEPVGLFINIHKQIETIIVDKHKTKCSTVIYGKLNHRKLSHKESVFSAFMWLAIYNTDFTATTFAEFGFSFILLNTFVWTTTIYVWAWICFKLTLTISYSHKILYHFQFGSQPFQSYNCGFMKLVCSFFSRKNKKSDIYSCWLFLVSTKKNCQDCD